MMSINDFDIIQLNLNDKQGIYYVFPKPGDNVLEEIDDLCNDFKATSTSANFDRIEWFLVNNLMDKGYYVSPLRPHTIAI